MAKVKNAPRHRRPGRPVLATSRKPIADREALKARYTGQDEFREQLGRLDADGLW